MREQGGCGERREHRRPVNGESTVVAGAGRIRTRRAMLLALVDALLGERRGGRVDALAVYRVEPEKRVVLFAAVVVARGWIKAGVGGDVTEAKGMGTRETGMQRDKTENGKAVTWVGDKHSNDLQLTAPLTSTEGIHRRCGRDGARIGEKGYESDNHDLLEMLAEHRIVDLDRLRLCVSSSEFQQEGEGAQTPSGGASKEDGGRGCRSEN
ncbi:hypothetical protein K438DRAFT_1785176 [Mycena galopus ATCC 62051]|nr:hypothetical protein K438DRAFT_1785176 [Mycena galopus ATCC 62051]